MKHFRWTMKELKETSNKNLILAVISERQQDLNPYALLGKRLSELWKWVDKNIPDAQEVNQ